MSRIAFSILFPILILVLAWGARAARKSGKDIGVLVSFLLITLIPPVLGNWMIIIARHRWLALAGSYIYFIGMDCVMAALMRFTQSYCGMEDRFLPVRKGMHWLFLIDLVQYALNPFFHHAFDLEEISLEGSAYFLLIPYAGQTFHRIVDYGILLVILIVFLMKTIHSARISSERYSVIMLTMVFTGVWETFYLFSRSPIDRSMVGFVIFGLLVLYFAVYYRPMRLLDRMLSVMVSGMQEAILFLDPSGLCIWANPRAMALTGTEGEDYERAKDNLRALVGGFNTREAVDWEERRDYQAGEECKSCVLEHHPVRDERGRNIGAFLSVRDNTGEHQMLESAVHRATHDSLTGAYNRAGYEMVLGEMDLSETCMLLVDLDNFKKINDTWGHPAGDRILKKTVEEIRRCFRANDMICRIGGDEFVVLMQRADRMQRDLIRGRGEKINESLAAGGESVPPASVSVGGAIGEADLAAEELFHRADKALYEVKRTGKKRVVFYEDLAES